MIATDDLRKAVYAALNGVITGKVYSAVPQGAAFPYTVLGPTTAVPDDDLSGEEGSDETITIFPWDSGSTTKVLVGVMKQIDAALHNKVLISGDRTFFVARDISETFTEQAADNATLQRGRMVYRAKTYE